MRTTTLLVSFGLLLIVALVLGCQPAVPTEPPYPTKQITYLIPFDPGGQSDREARRQQPWLERSLGQKIILDYRVGNGGALGWSDLVKAKPDGYLIAGINLPHIILQPLQQDVGYKTEQITPVFIFERTPMGLAVLNASPYKTLKEFLDAAKAKSGEFAIGGSGTFTGHHITLLRLQKMTGIQFKYVSYTGAAPQMADFMGGKIGAVIASTDDLVRYKDQIRILGVSDEYRFQALTDAPTFREGGFELIEYVDRGVGVPLGTPESVIRKLENVFLEISRMPDIQTEMWKQGYVPLAMNAKQAKEHIDKITPVYKEIVKDIK